MAKMTAREVKAAKVMRDVLDAAGYPDATVTTSLEEYDVHIQSGRRPKYRAEACAFVHAASGADLRRVNGLAMAAGVKPSSQETYDVARLPDGTYTGTGRPTGWSIMLRHVQY